ncbi:DUF4142 domain-containing protein [Oculatella sp. LEGE 06141]|uniref:DUF4142 domain-containing protein n=1 Tax=Oculatella sp. LEGE 06141 TaxID=1828648 RepID=UPI00187F25DD|nr:DUF4142 domain-containing protein [Oculatella sp. LEGE 06141]MBE9181102.1 DUF4142 domain-containing protein [Oculatella sp. LEGE 06141]
MKELNYIKKATTVAGAAAIASLLGLPALAQVNPNPSIFNEPSYDGNVQTFESNPSTPGLSQTNPNPSVLNESRYDGVPGTTQAIPATTPGQAQVNPEPGILNEAPYNQQGQAQQANPGPSVFNEAPYNGSGTPGTAPTGATSSPSINAAASITALDREFALMAAQGNQAEIRTSQLALQRATSDDVRAFAQQMIQEHTQANQQLQQIASQRGINLPADPGPLNTAIEQQLAQLSGEEFDRAYMEAQTNAHMRTVALFRTQIGQGQDEGLRAYASQLLPNIEQHYQMASQMTPNYRADDILQPLQ